LNKGNVIGKEGCRKEEGRELKSKEVQRSTRNGRKFGRPALQEGSHLANCYQHDEGYNFTSKDQFDHSWGKARVTQSFDLEDEGTRVARSNDPHCEEKKNPSRITSYW
jgi:hypothetical protein